MKRRWTPPKKLTFIVSGLVELASITMYGLNLHGLALFLSITGWIILAFGVTLEKL